jgi:hypothetical protein
MGVFGLAGNAQDCRAVLYLDGDSPVSSQRARLNKRANEPIMTKRTQQHPRSRRTDPSAGLRALERLREAFQVGRPYKDVLKTLRKKTQAKK